MGVAHADAGDLIADIIGLERFGDAHLGGGAADRHEVGSKDRGTHIDGDRLHYPIDRVEMEYLDAGARFERHLRLGGKAAIINEFADASGGISTHFSLRAIGIEHTHTEIGNLRGANSHETIRADAEMDIAHLDGKFRKVGGDRRCGIEVNIVITCAMHFGKSYFIVFDIHNEMKNT